MHRILPTNIFLCKIKVLDSPMCTFCREYKETLLHLFYECTRISKVCHELENWIQDKTPFKISLSPASVLLGISGCQNTAMNVVLLLFKQYIHLCRLRKMYVCFDVLKSQICCYYKVEKHMYRDKNCYHTFLNRWGGWHELLDDK